MNKMVVAMAVTRALFGLVSLTGGLLMFLSNDLQQAVKINSVIGSIGPFVFLLVSAIGLAGLAGQLETKKMLLLLAGVTFILLGTR